MTRWKLKILYFFTLLHNARMIKKLYFKKVGWDGDSDFDDPLKWKIAICGVLGGDISFNNEHILQWYLVCSNLIYSKFKGNKRRYCYFCTLKVPYYCQSCNICFCKDCHRTKHMSFIGTIKFKESRSRGFKTKKRRL